MMKSESPIKSAPVSKPYYVKLQQGVVGYESCQGKTGLIRSVRADGFLEVDFSCSGEESLVCLDAYLVEECPPPHLETDGRIL
ncbi:hypothetical protein [Gimesia sp.]|uniref:hypothetical protein n=1 Tax=Gimesia sp. TaxID=2024833 RepID=UPI000C3D691B|nr:hypothetical protein [Gimesia sp.]MAX37977.1 hypothetical protein [Gimesia sp.]HAH43740.1 hypothetical protein [Planctomycetaceae bacterium]HBL44970.1 hypothetical protein [Planctomycetaceae bacterium]|tara:strand:+ start:1615 stop:1863 length:249 start_codon:yes stop_codon:yes gene_type:complete